MCRKEGVVGRRNAFFILEIFRATHRAGLGGGYIPRRWRPQRPSAPGRPAHHRQQGRHTRHDTRPDAGHAAPVCTRYQTAHAGQIVTAAGCWVCPKLCRYGQRDFAILCQKNKSEKSYIFAQKALTYKIYLI